MNRFLILGHHARHTTGRVPLAHRAVDERQSVKYIKTSKPLGHYFFSIRKGIPKMNTTLDQIHHLAIQVNDIAASVKWYTDNFKCTVAYEDDTWALLDFSNISLALIANRKHPYHFAITRDDLSPYGEPSPHRDGTTSVYIKDIDGNNVEMIKIPEGYLEDAPKSGA